MSVKIIKTSHPDVVILEPDVFEDHRGQLSETFRADWFPDCRFVQDNWVTSRQNVLRGLHYQIGPAGQEYAPAQGKLIQVLEGTIFDVAVDLRQSSPHFKQSVPVTLEGSRQQLLWIPEGFAHGFLTLSSTSTLLYRLTRPYDPTADRAVKWDDPVLGIDWPLTAPPILSLKDENAPAFTSAPLFP